MGRTDLTDQDPKPLGNLSGANLSGADLTGARVSVSNLTGADLSGADLTGARVRETWIENANLTGVTWLNSQFVASSFAGSDLSRTDLQNADFVQVDNFVYHPGGSNLSGANLSFTDLRDVRFTFGPQLTVDPLDNAILEGVDFTGANMANLNLIRGSLAGAGFNDANLSGATLAYADLKRAGGIDDDMSGVGVDMSGVVMTGANLTQAYFAGANMSYVLFDQGNLTAAYLAGANLIEANLSRTNLTDANLTGANLTRANLTGANLTRTNLSGAAGTNLRSVSALAAAPPGANLTDANLTDANLTDANLTGADLTGADLTGADLSGADLTGADLTDVSGSFVGTPISLPAGFRVVNGYLVGPNADLSGADLSGADLSGADLSGADLSGADLSGANLTGASGCQIRGLPINMPPGYSIVGGCLTYTPPDTTAPTADPTVAPPANANGWNNTNVRVTWNWDDGNGSGIDPQQCAPGETSGGEGSAVTVTGSCTDEAGNTGTVYVTVKVDKTAPTLAPTVSPNPVLLNGVATADAGASDSLSGVDTQSCDPVNTSSVGSRSVQCTATDRAGNTTTTSVNYRVVYQVSAFSAPVDTTMVNKAKAGQTVPFKFTVTDANGHPVTNLTAVSTKAVAYTCESGLPVDAIEEYATGGSGLQNFADGTYQYNWKTPKTWRGCRTLSLDLGDGVNHTADFQFK